MELELIIMNMINYSGEARSLAMEAIQQAKMGDYTRAVESIEEANERLVEAHRSQTQLIQGEAKGERQDISLLLVHAQDHLMNAITIKDMAMEFIELYKILFKEKGS